MIGGIVLLAVFVGIETRVTQPMLPLRLVTSRGRGGAYFTVLLAGIGLFGAFFFLPYYMQLILGYTALQTGVALLPMTGGTLLGSVLASRLMTRLPHAHC